MEFLTLFDLLRARNLVIVPRSEVALHATTILLALARTAQERGNALFIDVLEQHSFEAIANNFNLLASFFVKEPFAYRPDSREHDWSVYNKQVTHDFWVIIRANLGGKLDKSVDLPVDGGDASVGEVQYRETLLNFLA